MAVAASRHQRRRRPPGNRRFAAAWLGTVLIVLNALGAALLPAAAAEHGQRLLAGLDGDLIVLCTPSGLRVVDRDGNQVGDNIPLDAAGGQGQCAFCLPLTNGVAATPAAPAVLPLPAAPLRLAALPAAERPPVARLHHRPNAARAPPAA